MPKSNKGASAPAENLIDPNTLCNAIGRSTPSNSRALKLAPIVQIHNPNSKKVDQDCIDLLRSLLRLAEAGQISGFIYGLIKTNGRYETDVAGLARNNSTFGIGILEVLKSRLLDKALNR